MTQTITALKDELTGLVTAAADLSALDEARVAALGKNGRITGMLKTLGSLDPEARKTTGQALEERLNDIPEKFEPSRKLFARRLTGEDSIATNPDGLQENGWGGNRHYAGPGENNERAFYQQYGDTYVVSVPRVIRGVFNQAADDKTAELHFTGGLLRMSDGYRYEWITPPDSTPVPYSKVIELREKQLGDQTAPRQVSGPMVLSDLRPR